MIKARAWLDFSLSLSIFVVFLAVSIWLSGFILEKQVNNFQTEPVLTQQTIRYLLNRSAKIQQVALVFNLRELLALNWLKTVIHDSQIIGTTGIVLLVFLICLGLRSWRVSLKKRRLQTVFKHTFETAFVLTSLAMFLSPFLAWAYERWLFPSWRLNLGSDNLLRLLYPIVINELVLVLALTTLLAAALVGFFLILEPKH